MTRQDLLDVLQLAERHGAYNDRFEDRDTLAEAFIEALSTNPSDHYRASNAIYDALKELAQETIDDSARKKTNVVWSQD